MNPFYSPATPAEFVELIRVTPRMLPVGARTKPGLSSVSPDVALLSTERIKGILEYEPDEFTFTALAGTPIADLVETLKEKGQYLPFDPFLVAAGATLGGTVASGLSGPGRFRFGGIRDFILGIKFIDGSGKILRLGGKVVKNAAGFDFPKFFTGSLGRFGVLIELTFKVFPRPPGQLTLRLPVSDSESATRVFMAAANSRWEPDALDLLPSGDAVALRIAGPKEALPKIADEILGRWPGEILPEDAAAKLWAELREFSWADPGGILAKIALTPRAVPALVGAVRGLAGKVHISSGGNVAYASLPSAANLANIGFPTLALRGSPLLGNISRPVPDISLAVKAALDPDNHFPSLYN
jgi:glycolate oxidase FAD binding subunit